MVGGRRAKVLRGRKLRAIVRRRHAIRLTGLPHGKVRVQVALRTTKGRTISRSKTYVFC